MCLIILRPADVEFDEESFRIALFHNPDGAGFMWADNGKIHGVKGLFNTDTILRYWEETKDRTVAVHLRYATSGDVTGENAHPYQVLNLEEHGRDLWVMHNGTLHAVPIRNKARSDTYHFVENYLKPLLIKNPDQLYDETFQEFLGLTVTGGRLLFMEGSGAITIINKEAGSKRGLCWISNKYSVVRPKPKKTRTTNRYNVLHSQSNLPNHTQYNLLFD